jgi:hypothetical protein
MKEPICKWLEDLTGMRDIEADFGEHQIVVCGRLESQRDVNCPFNDRAR